MIVIAGLVAPLVGLMLFDLVRRRSLRRMALRNIVRRPVEALLVVGGAALGTAIITSAFVVGDTFDTSIRDIGRTQFGPVDEVVETDDIARVDQLASLVGDQDDPLPHVDGVMPLVWAPAAAAAGDTRDTARAEPQISVAEMDFDAGRAFGGDTAATGLADAGATPGGTEAVLNEHLADELQVSEGDAVEVFAYGETRSFTVRDVLPQVGLAGYVGMYVAPGTIAELANSSPGEGAPPVGEVLVSNDGGVFDGATHSDDVTAALETRLGSDLLHEGTSVDNVKQDLLEDAESSGAEVRDLFTMMGIFSALVGVLLLVNLFVMLAEERKAELGMLRAVGMKRNHLVRLFGLEGGLYSLAAAVLGALGGIAVGKVLVLATESVIATDDDLTFVFDAKPSSLVTGALIGLAISLLTVWGTSARIARLNVIRAIRDLPEPAVRRTSIVKLLLSGVGVLAGVVMTNAGISGNSPVLTFIGPAAALGSAVPLFSLWLPRRGVVAVAGALSGLWAITAVAVVPDVFDDAGMEMFVAQGVVLVAAAVALVSQADRAWAWVADRLADRGGLASRLAVAYPLARRVRTGILLAMFSLVIFTMTFMSAISDANLAQAPAMARDAAAGWDLWVDSSPTNPLPAAAVNEDDDVAGTATLLRGYADLSVRPAGGGEASDEETWPVTGYDDSWLTAGVPELTERLDRFPDDRAALEAVAADPTLAVANDQLLDGEGPPGGKTIELGDTVTAVDPGSGREQTFTLAAFVDVDWNGNGLMIGRDAAGELLGDNAVDNRMYVSVADGADPEAVSERLTAEWIEYGADASTFVTAVEDEMKEMQGFIRLLQGYLGLGLLIGILGLGVVMVRAVRERRRQIGMLRAMGFSARVVRRAFLAEAGFVAVQGIVLGIGLGLVVSYQMLQSDVMGDPLPFTVPWLAVAVLLLVPGSAAMLAALAPAAQASRIQPAAALRIAE